MDSPEGLLSRCFAEFYEELANIKVASAQGRLPSYLEGPNTPADIAAATATKLRALLAEQEKRVHAKANQTERQSYALARYFMAALADEVLGLTLDWEGGEHWQHHLLERHLFGRSIAGSQFYAQTDKVLNARGNDPLMTDLASVALMALPDAPTPAAAARRGAPSAPARPRPSPADATAPASPCKRSSWRPGRFSGANGVFTKLNRMSNRGWRSLLRRG